MPTKKKPKQIQLNMKYAMLIGALLGLLVAGILGFVAGAFGAYVGYRAVDYIKKKQAQVSKGK